MKILFAFCLTFSMVFAQGDIDDLNSSSAEKIMEQSDTSSIENAVMRLEALNNRVKRLRNKLTNELETTVSFLKFHLTQRKLQDGGRRVLEENPFLDQGKIDQKYTQMVNPHDDREIPNI